MARIIKKVTAMDAVSTATNSPAINVQSYEFVNIAISPANSADMVVKVQGGFGLTAFAPGTAKSVSNPWDYIDIIDLEDGASVDGDTGLTFVNADDVRQFSVNVDTIDWLAFETSGVTDGDVTINVFGYNNQ